MKTRLGVGVGNLSHKISLLLCLAALAVTGCTNGKKFSSTSSKSSSTNSIAQNGSIGGGGGLAVAFTPYVSARVTGAIDLVGDSNVIGDTCINSDSSGTKTFLCGCQISYTRSTGAVESYIQPASWVEANLLRCVVQIPTDVQSIDIRLYQTASKASTVTVNLAVNRGNQGFNYSLPEAFFPVRKFQCHEHPNLPFPLDGSVYDPFEASDPALAYGSTFYSTNFANSYYQHSVNNKSAGHVLWECPTTPFNAIRPPVWEDQRLFSLAADSNVTDPKNAKVIENPEDPLLRNGTKRSNYYLARAPGGIFTVPVNALVAPQVGGTLGYAASPNTITAGQEQCPAVNPPDGFHWVKVWLFRGVFPDRVAIDPSDTALATINTISCSPGTYPGTTDKWVYPDCATTSLINPPYSRLFHTGSCYKLNPTGTSGRDYGFPQTTDALVPIGGSYHQAQDYSCGGSSAKDPMSLCGTDHVAAKIQPSTIDLDVSASRAEFVFVVTPPEVMSGEMYNTSSSAHNQYVPYRFLYKGLCDLSATNPLDPEAAPNCQLQSHLKLRVNYEITQHDMLTNGDPKNNPGGFFPVCAVQPNEGIL